MIHASITRAFNGFLSDDPFSVQNWEKLYRLLRSKEVLNKTFLIPKIVIDTIN